MNNVLNELKTYDKATEFLNLLRDVSVKTYSNDFSIDIFKESFSQDFLKNLPVLNNIDDLRAMHSDFETLLSEVNIVDICLTFLPSRDFICNLYKIFESRGFKDFLFRVKVKEQESLFVSYTVRGVYKELSQIDMIKSLLSKIYAKE